MSSIWSVKAGTLEEKVQILWNGILNTYFPPTQPYRIGIKAAVLTDNNAPDAVIFEIRASMIPRSSEDFQERQIFMAECKRISEDTTAGWEGAELQLATYIEANTNSALCGGMYGACAIGKKVTFYEWIRLTGLLTPMTGRLDMEHPTHRPHVEDMLSHIKQNGWQRTN